MKRALLLALFIVALSGCGQAAVPETADIASPVPAQETFEEEATATVTPEPTATTAEPTRPY